MLESNKNENENLVVVKSQGFVVSSLSLPSSGERMLRGLDLFFRRGSSAVIALSSAYDGDILRKACNWIDAHNDHFGKTILDIKTPKLIQFYYSTAAYLQAG